MPGHQWTEEEKSWLKQYIPGHSEAEIIEAFQQSFGWRMRRSQLKNMKTALKIGSGTQNGQFKKGHVPYNKGKHSGARGNMFQTMFKPGNIPHNHKPVGSEVIDRDGYVRVKIADPRKWTYKHRLVWSQHNGAIPKGAIVVFLDGNKLNFDIDNLMMLTRTELVRANQDGVWELPQELRRTALITVKLKVAAGITKGHSNG